MLFAKVSTSLTGCVGISILGFALESQICWLFILEAPPSLTNFSHFLTHFSFYFFYFMLFSFSIVSYETKALKVELDIICNNFISFSGGSENEVL